MSDGGGCVFVVVVECWCVVDGLVVGWCVDVGGPPECGVVGAVHGFSCVFVEVDVGCLLGFLGCDTV